MLASSVHLKLHMKNESEDTDTHPSLHIYVCAKDKIAHHMSQHTSIKENNVYVM